MGNLIQFHFNSMITTILFTEYDFFCVYNNFSRMKINKINYYCCRKTITKEVKRIYGFRNCQYN